MKKNFRSASVLTETITGLIETAESYILGAKKGNERRGVVVDKAVNELEQIAEQVLADLKSHQHLSEAGKHFRWVDFLGQLPEFRNRVGAVVDAVVALGNFLNSFEQPIDKLKVN